MLSFIWKSWVRKAISKSCRRNLAAFRRARLNVEGLEARDCPSTAYSVTNFSFELPAVQAGVNGAPYTATGTNDLSLGNNSITGWTVAGTNVAAGVEAGVVHDTNAIPVTTGAQHGQIVMPASAGKADVTVSSASPTTIAPNTGYKFTIDLAGDGTDKSAGNDGTAGVNDINLLANGVVIASTSIPTGLTTTDSPTSVSFDSGANSSFNGDVLTVQVAAGDTSAATSNVVLNFDNARLISNLDHTTTTTATTSAATQTPSTAVTFTATVVDNVSPATIPAGSVQFFANGSATPLANASSQTTFNLSGGQASITLSTLTTGAYEITAVYTPSDSHVSSTGYVAENIQAANFKFTTGDLVVDTTGNGTTALSNASAPVYLDQYTTTGTSQTPVSSTILPLSTYSANGVTNNEFTVDSNGGDGLLQDSVDGRSLVLEGFQAAPGTSGLGTTGDAVAQDPREVALVSNTATQINVDTSTAINDAYDSKSFTSATTLDGQVVWTSGEDPSGGVRTVLDGNVTNSGNIASSSPVSSGAVVKINTVSVVKSSNGSTQLVTSSTDGIAGLATIGGTPTNNLNGDGLESALNGLNNSVLSPSQFVFASTNTGTPENPASGDLVYVADTSTTSGFGGLQKWEFTGGAWQLQYTLQPGQYTTGVPYQLAMGVVAVAEDPHSANTFYVITTQDSTIQNGPNYLIQVTDGGSLLTQSYSLLATSPANEFFHGVAFAPSVSGTTAPATFTLSSPGAANYGAPLTLTATVTGTPTPTGYVTFRSLDGNTIYGVAPLNGSGVATFTPTAAITAINAPSTTITINTTLAGAQVGQLVVISGVGGSGYNGAFTITAVGAGTISYTDTSSLSGTPTLTHAYASFSGALALGTDDIVAVYGGDGTYAKATSNTLAQQINTISVAPTITSIPVTEVVTGSSSTYQITAIAPGDESAITYPALTSAPSPAVFPTGTTISSTGLITFPSTLAAGNYSFIVTAQNDSGVNSTTQTFALIVQAAPAPFTGGDLVVLQSGDGLVNYPSGTGAPVFLDEINPTATVDITGTNTPITTTFTPDASLNLSTQLGTSYVEQIAIPGQANNNVPGNQPLTIDLGSPGASGSLNRSADGSELAFTGDDAPIGGIGVGDSQKTIGVVGVNPIPSNINTTTDGTFDVGDENRGAVIANSTTIYNYGHPPSGGLRYFNGVGADSGTTISDDGNGTISNVRGATIAFNGRLYWTTAAKSTDDPIAGVYTSLVGALPTTPENQSAPITQISATGTQAGGPGAATITITTTLASLLTPASDGHQVVILSGVSSSPYNTDFLVLSHTMSTITFLNQTASAKTLTSNSIGNGTSTVGTVALGDVLVVSVNNTGTNSQGAAPNPSFEANVAKLGPVWFADMNGTGVLQPGDRLYYEDGDDSGTNDLGTGPAGSAASGERGTSGIYVSTLEADGVTWTLPQLVTDGPAGGQGDTGSPTTPAETRGLIGEVLSPTDVQLYATDNDLTAGDVTSLISVNDVLHSGSADTVTSSLMQAAPNDVPGVSGSFGAELRGVAFAPVGATTNTLTDSETGGNLTLTVNLSTLSSGAPNGFVGIMEDGTLLPFNSSETLASTGANSSRATYVINGFSGAHSFEAIYDSGAFAAANSNTLTTAALSAVTAPNPSNATQALTFNVTVPVPGIAPTGTVEIVDASNSNHVVASGTLIASNNGSINLTIPAQTIFAGLHNLQAVYLGDSNNPATSLSNTIAQQVNLVILSATVDGSQGNTTITSASENGTGLVTIQTAAANGFTATNEPVEITVTGQAGYNGIYDITQTSPTTFTYQDNNASGLTPVTGTNVGSAVYALSGPQRSMVTNVVYVFSEPVNTLTASDFTLGLQSGVSVNGGPGQTVGNTTGVNLTVSNPSLDGMTWVVGFSGTGITAGSLTNGVYTMLANTSLITSQANSSQSAQARSTDTFARMFGSVAGEVTVSNSTTVTVKAANANACQAEIGLLPGAPTYEAYFDASGAGTRSINASDLSKVEADIGETYTSFLATI
jgi:hypothetical protein